MLADVLEVSLADIFGRIINFWFSLNFINVDYGTSL